MAPYLLSTRHQFCLHCHAATSLPRQSVNSDFVTPPALLLSSRRHTFLDTPPVRTSSSCRHIPSLSRCWFCHRRCATTLLLIPQPHPSSTRRQFCLYLCATMPFLVTPSVLPLSLRRHALPLSRRQFCLRPRATIPFLNTPSVLPSSSPHNTLPRVGSAFVVAPSLSSLSRCHTLPRHAFHTRYFQNSQEQRTLDLTLSHRANWGSN